MHDVALPRSGLRTLHLFAGAGGGILADLLLGHIPVCAVEINPYCRDVLIARQRDGQLGRFPIWDDVRTFDGTRWRGHVDVISGGFPCQPFSSASRGRARAVDLWPEMLRIIRDVAPRYVIAENVKEWPIQRAAQHLGVYGYSTKVARVSAACVGAPHRRARYWLVADANSDGKRGLRQHAEMAGPSAPFAGLWSEKPDAGDMGISNGLAHRLDRLAALGNGQIPAVAALAWETLSQ